MNRSYALRLVALASSFAVMSVVGCTAGTVTQVGPGLTSPDGGPGSEDPDGAAPGTSTKDGSADAKPDADEPVPTTPFFDVKINGETIPVKNVTVNHTNVYPDNGVSYYEIKATLSQTPPIVDGMDEDPSIVIRVAKDEVGTDVCKEKRGPQVGAIQPVIELREVQIHYSRFTGTQGVNAFPSTKSSGSCNMLLKSSAAKGNAWGEVTGSLQAGSDEPTLAFEAKWFQQVTWN